MERVDFRAAQCMVSASTGGIPGVQNRVFSQMKLESLPLRIMFTREKKVSRSQQGDDEWERILDTAGAKG